MKIAGIISEYNPFHNGHEYLVKFAKERSDAVVAVMSGNYTQRGELAIADKYIRAETAVKNGVDLVLELPFPFAVSSAEFFAKGGVTVLKRIGADSIYFGSESGNVDFITEAAVASVSDKFLALRKNISHDGGFAEEYFDSLNSVVGTNEKLLSNDILAVEYAKMIKRLNLNIKLCAVKRLGDSYNETKISSEFASATAIRNHVRRTGLEGLGKHLSEKTISVLKRAFDNGEAPTDVTKIEMFLLAYWRLAEPEKLSGIAELGNGLEYRIKKAALSSTTLADLEKNAAAKKYTATKIRRAMLYAPLDITKADLDSEPEYTLVLAANEKGRKILSLLRKDEAALKIVTKPADVPQGRQKELSDRADALYTLTMPVSESFEYLTKKKIYVE